MGTETNIIELAAEVEPAKEIVQEPITKADLKEKGWSKEEIASAEKRGMLPSDEKKEEKKEVVIKDDVEEKAPEKIDPAPEKKPESSLPDFTFKTPEQEKAFLDAFGPKTPQRAMYFRMKNERLSRQRAEAERDRIALELQMYKDQKLNLDKPPAEVDEQGNEIDPEDRPLTIKQLKALQAEQMERINREKSELEQRSSKVAEAMKAQEEYAKATMPDFDETVKLAKDLVENIEQVPESWKKNKIVKLLKDLQATAASADQFGVDDYTAPMIAYELGQLHPHYGQPAEQNGTKKDPKANGSLTPEQLKRIEENTQRRTSSASLPGSSNGRRSVSVEDITIKDVLKMTPEERYKFKKDHPEKMAKLMRG